MSGFLYRFIMRIAHRYNWHYAPPIYLNGDTQLWCKWCGFRQTIKKMTKPKCLKCPDCKTELKQQDKYEGYTKDQIRKLGEIFRELEAGREIDNRRIV